MRGIRLVEYVQYHIQPRRYDEWICSVRMSRMDTVLAREYSLAKLFQTIYHIAKVFSIHYFIYHESQKTTQRSRNLDE